MKMEKPKDGNHQFTLLSFPYFNIQDFHVQRNKDYLLYGSELKNLIYTRSVDKKGDKTSFKDQSKVQHFIPAKTINIKK